MTRIVLIIATTGALLAGCAAGGSSGSAAPAASATPSTNAALSSPAKVVAAFRAAKLTVNKYTEQNEKTDPNRLLGRPNQYTARVSFDVPGGDPTAGEGDIARGGVIEVWPSPQAAERRAELISEALQGDPSLGAEYQYTVGSMLVRIIGDVLPSVAKRYEAALK